MVSVFIPDRPFVKHPSTDPRTYNVDADLSTEELGQETDLERSIRRTKKRIGDYILCNHFELFVTFTFAKNRQDIDQKRRQMSDWIRNQRKRNGRFDYLIIPELHKDGESLHFHALFYGYCGSIRPAINPKTNQAVRHGDKPVYTLPEYTLGFNNAQNISASPDDQLKVSAYVKKYITKDMPTFRGKQRYWASKKLALPKIQDNPEKWYELIRPDWEFEVASGKILRFKVGSHPLVDLYWEANR
jgi:hypothetical protein